MNFACINFDFKQEKKGEKSGNWVTLSHNGVIFPPAYTPLPDDVKLIYDGKPIDLEPEAEEVATFYAVHLLGEAKKTENAVSLLHESFSCTLY